MKIGILGTGKAAHALAQKWSAAGHSITFGSRDPSTSKDPIYPVVTHAEAADAVQLVVNVTPGAATLDVVKQIGPDVLADKTLVDAANAVTSDLRLLYPNDSLGERLQQMLPQTNVVKTLNTLNISVMTNPGAVPPSTIFLSGDDEQAKKTVSELLQELGWPTDSVLDLGDITTARGPEHYFIMFATMLSALRTPLFNIRLVK